MKKMCGKCFEEKPSSSFHKDKTKYDGLRAQCKSCYSEYLNSKNRTISQKEWRESSQRDKELQRKYGIDINQYRKMENEQGFRCKICKRVKEKTLAVDHCHLTGKVRGLLCDYCNTGLGSFRDSILSLESAIAYLKESKC